jgi:hypothetical protein
MVVEGEAKRDAKEVERNEGWKSRLKARELRQMQKTRKFQ